MRLADFAAYHRQAKRGFEAAVADGVDSYPVPNSHCPVCPYHDSCEERWRSDDQLVRVAALSVEQARRLEAAGIATAGELAAFEGDRIAHMAQATLLKLRQQARLQQMTTLDGRPAYELLETPGEGIGTTMQIAGDVNTSMSVSEFDPDEVFWAQALVDLARARHPCCWSGRSSPDDGDGPPEITNWMKNGTKHPVDRPKATYGQYLCSQSLNPSVFA